MKATVRPPAPEEDTQDKPLTSQQVFDELRESVYMPGSFTLDNDGQLVMYSGIYRWKNDTYHYRPEPKANKKRAKRA